MTGVAIDDLFLPGLIRTEPTITLTVLADSTQQLPVQAHLVEGVAVLIPISVKTVWVAANASATWTSHHQNKTRFRDPVHQSFKTRRGLQDHLMTVSLTVLLLTAPLCPSKWNGHPMQQRDKLRQPWWLCM